MIGEYRREDCDLAYERILLVGLEYPDDIDEIVQIYAPTQGKIAEDTFLRLRTELARFKVVTLHGDNEPDATVLSFNRLAEHIGAIDERYEAEYWLAEGIAAMCVSLAQFDSSDVEISLGELRDIYNKMGRQDRLAAVEKAVEAWRAGDQAQFKREFAYLLTF